VLTRLNKQYPNQPIGQHLAIALADYPAIDISNKEMLYALSKYEQELELGESFNNRYDEDFGEQYD